MTTTRRDVGAQRDIVRCFRRLDEGKLRHGVWVMMLRCRGCKGLFVHGDRDEVQAPRHSVAELTEWAVKGGFLPVEELSVAEALGELESWPEVQEWVRNAIERHMNETSPCKHVKAEQTWV